MQRATDPPFVSTEGTSFPAASASFQGTHERAPSVLREHNHQQKLDELRERARNHVKEVIEQLPLEVKTAYLQAIEKAPDLVRNESDPMQFLRRCDYDIWAAAQRLCRYWQERLDIFGPDRAFLPLDLTGNGALEQNDILSLQAGFPALLPKTKLGQQVVLVDRRQHVPFLTIQNRWRSAFYLANILAKDEHAQTEGVWILNILSMPRYHDYDRKGMRRAHILCRDVFPLKGKIHLVNIPPNVKGSQSARMYSVQKLVSSFVSTLLDIGSNAVNIEVHFERETGQMLSELEEMGLQRDGIPDFLGGSWGFEKFGTWCRERAEKEVKERGAHLAQRQEAKSTEPPAAAAESKKRAKNIIHSRQKRARRKQELTSMMEEKDRLVREIESLRAEEERLAGLLQQAQAIAADPESHGLRRALQSTQMAR
mmetsp:Transcript_20348/g.56179  ORF Transcript_20348/g.56179 Transcript_20348/m.56179 type:complete len:425 (+) Transcript_20348:75-1349(+)